MIVDTIKRKSIIEMIKQKSTFSPFFSLAAIVIALLLGVVFGVFGFTASAVVVGVIVMICLFLLRQDQLIVTLIIMFHIYIDWYLVLLVPGQLVTVILLFLFFLCRSPERPWRAPRALWLWTLFLLFAVYPAIKGASRPYDLGFYYPNVFVGALLSFWLGIVIAKDLLSLRRFFKMLAFLGTLLAVHTLIQYTTGITLFGNSRFDQFLAGAGNFQLTAGSGVYRVGSFFIDPNWNGTFLATIFFLPLGLLMVSSSLLEKACYIIEMLLILPALLFTYSNGAWIGVLCGFAVFVLLVGRLQDRLLFIIFALIAAFIGQTFFLAQINLQFQHATAASELSLRIGAWQTGINVMLAFPLTGIGLGFNAYLQGAEPYRSVAQYLPLDHPHNSYIELGAKAGIPVLITFLALLLFALWQALYNRNLCDKGMRSLLGGGIAAIVALAINSWSINAWTLPPLAAIGWTILGAVSSPILMASLKLKGEK